jgi:hypothetical protein
MLKFSIFTLLALTLFMTTGDESFVVSEQRIDTMTLAKYAAHLYYWIRSNSEKVSANLEKAAEFYNKTSIHDLRWERSESFDEIPLPT